MGESSPELSTGESNLGRLVERLSSLLSLSYSIKVFHGKWQLIRTKLEELITGLTSSQNCDLAENTAFLQLIIAILATVNDCYNHAYQCVDLSYSGKLLMQSDLGVISSKFDVHLKSLNGIYTSGILTQGYAIVVSRPSFGACRDDMKFYVNDLLTRLKIGASVMKNQALVALSEVVQEDDKYVKIVIETDEIITLLVNFLEIGDIELQEESAKVVLVIAGFDPYKDVLVEGGIIGPLIHVLEAGTDLGKERASRILQKLTENSENAWSVSAHGGVTILINICTTGEGKGDLINPVFGVLRNLVGVEEMKRFMVEERSISTFVKLMNSTDETLLINAMEFLQLMASGDAHIRQLIIREGGIYSLVRVLDPKSSFSSKARETALKAIDSLCFSSTSALNMLMGYGFLDRVLFFLRNGEISIQELAVKAAFSLSGISEETKKAMGDAGFMPELVRFLDAKSFEVREMAAEVLSSMVWVPKNRKRFVHEDCDIDRVVQLLDPDEVKTGNKRFLISTLMSLTNSNSGRKKIANSGYLKNIEKLAEAEVPDAKKIIKKLSTNRFRNILRGILNS
ncbi:hypothetical protein GIB67_040324 [Kingdonia uniflora]|uniref:DUF7032 domain-containing protein n=1 Tax=Kingdonia uniflora TaxID=39325 RepID=A0A7J7L742_9MAGN|nr:hypothetical protein GIB67_040324 [Kingdonia uniflora]